jgi:hypothetical protein
MVGQGSLMFKDPFSRPTVQGTGQGSPVSPSRATNDGLGNGTGAATAGALANASVGSGVAPAIPPYVASSTAAWAAPESWGVEADEVAEEDESVSSSGTDEAWTECTHRSSRSAVDEDRRDSAGSVGSPKHSSHDHGRSHHGHHSHSHHGHGHKHKTKAAHHNGFHKSGTDELNPSVEVSTYYHSHSCHLVSQQTGCLGCRTCASHVSDHNVSVKTPRWRC